MKKSYRGMVVLVAAAVAVSLSFSTVQGARLTSAHVFSTDAGGSPAGNFVWDTLAGTDYYKIFITRGSPGGAPNGLTAPFINGPTWSLVPIDITLTEGPNAFTMFFQDNGPWNAFGLNLFLVNGSQGQISVKAPLRTGSNTPPFTANSAPNTYPGPASGMTQVAIGDEVVKLTQYFVAASNQFRLDRVGTHSVGAEGRLDYVGSFTLLLVRTPRITSPPQNLTLQTGGSGSFSVVAEGVELRYQWLKNGAEIPGANSPTLFLNDVQPSQAGNYSVRVSNDAGVVTSAEATLTVTPSDPGSARLTALFVFSANGAGSPAGDFVWDTRGSDSDFYKAFLTRGVPQGDPDGLTAPFINGPTWAQAPINIPLSEGTHEFTTIFQHNGNWNFFAMNLFLQGSNVVQISVKGPARTNNFNPPFTPNSAPVTYSMTSYPSPNAPASGSLSAVVNGMRVTLTDYYVATTPVFSVDRVGTHNVGANARLDFVGTFTLNVERVSSTAPTIVSHPESQTVEAGGRATFRVTAEGSGLSYQWLKGNAEISGATSAELTIENAQASDAGDYSVRVSNDGGSVTSNPATLTVTTPPPTETPVRLTAVFEFSTEADGDLAGNLVWDTRGSESDFYKGWLTRGSPPGSLSNAFINGPSWAQAPINIALREGENRFTAFGQNVRDEWPHFGINLFFQTSRVAQISAKGATRTGNEIPPFSANSSPSTYSMTSFPNPDAPASGRTRAVIAGYLVELTEYYMADDDLFNRDRVQSHQVGANGSNDFVWTFTLNVSPSTLTPPTIVTPPESQTVDAGADVTFTVVAEGSEPLSYQWLRNGVAIDGATSAQLTLSNVQVAASGQYSVRVSNDAGSVIAGPATLTVRPPITGTGVRLTAVFEFSTDADGRPAGNLVWDTRGSESDFYKAWLTPGTPEGNPDGLSSGFINGPTWAQAPINIALEEGTNRFTTFLQNVRDEWPNFGLNLFFQDSRTAQICAKGPTRTGNARPPFTANSAPVTYSMTSFPNPDAPASGRTRTVIGDFIVELVEYYMTDDDVFDLDRVQSHQTGANGVLDFIGTFTLVVRRGTLAPPTILTPPQNQTVNAGANVTFRVTAEGSEPLSYQWLKNGAVIPGATTPELTLHQVQGADAGEYSVRVSNDAGTATASATLTVIPPPRPPGANLTALFQFSSDTAGNPAGNFVWDTRGRESDFYKVFLTGGTPEGNPDGLTAPFINGPDWARAPINISLQEGTHRFTTFFQHNGDWNHFALNLFFHSNRVAQISAKAPLRTGEAIPPFTANSAPVTYSMSSFPAPNAPASGTTRTTIGEFIVELTEYHVAATGLFNADRVGTHNVGVNNRRDFVGTFTLVVRHQSALNTPPVAHIDLSPELRLPGQAHPFVIACNGQAAVVTLDARGSSDADGDALTYAWFVPGSATPFSTASVTVNSADVGTHTVNLRVSDGTDHTDATLTFEVITPAEAVAGISALLDASGLSPKALRSLKASLEAAMNSAERGKLPSARNQLEAFQNKVEAQLGHTDPALARTLIDATQAVIDNLNCPDSEDH